MKTLRLFFLLLITPALCFSWNSSGHMTAGAVTYYYLKKNNPAVLQKVLASFKQHPWYATEWAKKMNGLNEDQKEIALFMLASTWPDDTRKDSVYGGPEHAKWHYINYPFVPAGQTITLPPIPQPNAEEKLIELVATIGAQADSKDKAINLCWLFHITEDVHQPLHTVALFDAAHPNGDRGGNDTYIRLPKIARDTVLHTYWDALVPGKFNTIPSTAQALLKNAKYREPKLHELVKDPAIKDWIEKEGVAMAKTTVYKNGTINGTKNNPTLVTKTYIKNAAALAERRVVLAGIRLARELIKLYS